MSDSKPIPWNQAAEQVKSRLRDHNASIQELYKFHNSLDKMQAQFLVRIEKLEESHKGETEKKVAIARDEENIKLRLTILEAAAKEDVQTSSQLKIGAIIAILSTLFGIVGAGIMKMWG